MLKRITSILFSTRLMAILFIVFAIAMAIGTFLDAGGTDSPTPYSRALIYNTWWFELIMLLFTINFLGNIKRYQLHKRKNWSVLSLHLAFILIFVGAFITRYISYEGIMHIREGETSDMIISDDTYVSVFIDGNFEKDGVPQRRVVPNKKVRFDERLNNKLRIKTDYMGQPVDIRFVDYFDKAKIGIVPSEDTDEEYLEIVISSQGTRESHFVKNGGVTSIDGMLFSLNNETEAAINIFYDTETESFEILTPYGGDYMVMTTQEQFPVYASERQQFNLGSLYHLAGIQFVMPKSLVKGSLAIERTTAMETPNAQEGLILDVSSNGETQRAYLLGGRGYAPSPQTVNLAGLDVHIAYSSKVYNTPFQVELKEFIAEKFPGTDKNYKSFQSNVTVHDATMDAPFDYEIYMNHILNHGGYRFFQASFDPDEKGTVLSVNHDFWGTWITYIGYGLLYLGMLVIFFDKNTRFGKLGKQLKKIRQRKARMATLILLFLVPLFGFAQEDHNHEHEEAVLEEVVDTHNHEPSPIVRVKTEVVDSLIMARAVSKEHADKFAHLVIQDYGRMKPISTFASELLRRVSHKDTYKGLDANQVFISMAQAPSEWIHVPIIHMPKGNDSLRKIIGVDKGARHVALVDFFDDNLDYKLNPYLEAASSKANPSQIEKDLLKAHENYYLLNLALSGGILQIFPEPNSPNNKWISTLELGESNFKGQDSIFVRNVMPLYFQTIYQASQDGDYTQADNLLEGIYKFQHRFGAEVMPSDEKIELEVTYNKLDIFNKMYKYLILTGVVMFIIIIAQIFKERKALNYVLKGFKWWLWLLFTILTVGLVMRWYISGHAPMSDAYESVVYVAWATVLFGLILGRKSDLTLASTAFVGAMVLWSAHLNWMDPAISTLEPVLDSYWLLIHVSIIVMSYGPFTLGLILGTVVMLLILFTNKENKKRMDINIQELTVINEMALTVGLVLLTIGNFLGGQWANESWGRYWGWDPKETWALISIMIYAFVIHARLVPGLRGRWTFSMMSIFAYASIMMTYFGVNFYLAGLHSYASGDVGMTPAFVWYTLGGFAILCGLAYIKYKKHYLK